MNLQSKIVWGLLACVVMAAGPGFAQTNGAPPAENRFLLVVETSRTMQKRFEGLGNTLTKLLGSGMGGQMTRGDSLGIWTYNEQLHAGDFALQRWSPDTQKQVMAAALNFVRDQKFEKQARLARVIPPLNEVIKNSGMITVVMVTSGSEDISGTPFDEQINRTYRVWRDEQAKAHMPLVTILRGSHGRLTDYRVTPAPWQVEMPPMPEEPKLVKEKAKTPTPATTAQTKPVAPLIFSGKKKEPTTTVGPATPPAVKPESIISNSISAPIATAPLPVEKPAAVNTSAAPAVVIEPAPLSPTPASPKPAEQEPALRPGNISSPETKSSPAVESTSGEPIVGGDSLKETVKPEAAVAVVTPEHSRSVIYKRVFLFVMVTIGIVLGIVLLRRPRASEVSLITHSLGRKKD